MKLTHQQILDIHKTLQIFLKEKISTKLKFKMAMIRHVLQPIVDMLKQARLADDIPRAREFFQERQKALQLDKKQAALKLAALETEFAGPLKAILQREKEYTALLQDNSELQITKLLLDLFPEEIEVDISPLLPIIQEEEEGKNASD